MWRRVARVDMGRRKSAGYATSTTAPVHYDEEVAVACSAAAARRAMPLPHELRGRLEAEAPWLSARAAC